ncbi:MAG: hypothetical protein LBD72_00790 [Puniceicoccales bacterium]|jgi:hypothetical protein|nr:hypothetical protein [Puniceicoccales bacterium]
MIPANINGSFAKSTTLDAIVEKVQRGRTESKLSLTESTRVECVDVEAILARLSGVMGFFTHVKILVEIGAFPSALAAIFAIVCRDTRNSAVYVRVLACTGRGVQRPEISTTDAGLTEVVRSKISRKIAAILDQIDLNDTFADHGIELNRVAESLSDANIQTQIADVTRTDLLSLRTSPAARVEFAQKAQALLRAIAANNPTEDNAVETMTSIYGHCEALLIIAISLDSGGIYAHKTVKALGSGAFNSTFLFAPGSGEMKVFKPLSIEKSLVARRKDNRWNIRAGVDLNNTANRNLGTCAVAELFGHQELVVGTRMVVVNGRVGLSMERASGISVSNASRKHGLALRNDPQFQRQCSWLQLQDCITGNIDRHFRNLNWDRKSKRLMAFDNDMAFIDGDGRSFGDTIPESLYFSVSIVREGSTREVMRSADGKSPRNYCCPPVIDEEMREKVLALGEETLRNSLQNSGLSQRQIKAACSRLRRLKELIQDSAKVTVIPLDGWGESIPNKCHWHDTYFMAYTATRAEKSGFPPPSGATLHA